MGDDATARLAELRMAAGDGEGALSCMRKTVRAMVAALSRTGRNTSPSLERLKARLATIQSIVERR